MEYLKLQLRDAGEIEWARASMALRGVLVTILLRCALLENDGCIEGCKTWSNADWLATFGVRLKDVDGLVKKALASWDGNDLELAMYDHIGQQRLETQREQGHHGASGGHAKAANKPKINPKGYPRGYPHTTPPSVGRVASPKGSTPPAPLDLVVQGPGTKPKMNLKALMAETEKKGTA